MTTRWVPEIGDWVIYRPHPTAEAEDGEVTGIVGGTDSDLVLVRYRGDRHSKATYVQDLAPGVTQ